MCSCDNLKAMDNSILYGRCRDREVGMAEFDRIGDNLTLVVRIDQFEAAVWLRGWTNVEAIFGMEVLGTARCRLSIDEDMTTNWP
jgi:hypothetical protein